jgi:hypothetical protein
MAEIIGFGECTLTVKPVPVNVEILVWVRLVGSWREGEISHVMRCNIVEKMGSLRGFHVIALG